MTLSDQKRRLIGRLSPRKTREREGLVLIEGVRAVGEALDAGVKVRFALQSQDLHRTAGGAALAERLQAAGFSVEDMTDREMAGAADTRSSQGVLLVCEEPSSTLDGLRVDSSARHLLLDGVQDPGNVGTMIRAARVFALAGVVVLDGSADPWGPKAVRSSAGSCFHIPVVTAPWREAEPWLVSAGVSLLAGDPCGHDVSKVRPPGPWGLVIGSEGAGVRPEILESADPVAVPMAGGSDSLNAAMAGAILLYALTSTGGP
ncbi:MAG: RNA methyltransferase [Gemmatimonadetes bacterium]|nr:RNA methyltransferase [Gemmatimonadota bacterium]